MVETNPLKWFIREIDIGDSGVKGSPGGAKVPPSGSGVQPGGGQRSSQAADKPNMFGHRIVRTRSRHDCHFATGASVPMGKQKHFSRACTVEDSTFFSLVFLFVHNLVSFAFVFNIYSELARLPFCYWSQCTVPLGKEKHFYRACTVQWEILPFFVSLFFWFVHQNPLPCP